MRNRVLRGIFHSSAKPVLDDRVRLPFVSGAGGNEAVGPVMQAFAGLLPQSPGQQQAAEQGSAAVNQSGSTGGDSPVSQIFGQVSKNLDLLRAVTEAQSTAVGANTAALASNTAQKSVTQVLSQAGQAASGLLGGLTAFPLISGIAKLFGFGNSSTAPAAPLQKFTAPAPVRFDAVTQGGRDGNTIQDAGYDRFGNARANGPEILNIPNYSALLATTLSTNTASVERTPADNSAGSVAGKTGSAAENTPGQTNQITVNVQAMDSRSFLDRSHDIAQAVREAMLNLHSINDVVNDL